MEQHGKALAASHQLAPHRAADKLLARLLENENNLIDTCRLLTAAVTAKRRICPAAVWLLDNFYLIEEQIRTARRHLPRGYSRELPRLMQGSVIGHPRVYDIAQEAISHGDGHVDTERLCRFVAAYQTITTLTLGELWAIPIMLRLAVIENLSRVATRIATGWLERNLADSWADQMTETAEKDPKGLILVIADMARSNPPMSSAFVAELARRLQGHGPSLALPLTWIGQRLTESGVAIEQLVQTENQQQAVNQVSTSNSVCSLRVLGAMDWRDFVESMSAVEKTLRNDPSGVYAKMDFATRDHYRHATEEIAKRSQLSESEIALKALDLAHANALSNQEGAAARGSHIGYYLVGEGRPTLEAEAQAHVPYLARIARSTKHSPLLCYLGAIASVTLCISLAMLDKAANAGIHAELLIAIGLLLLIAISQFALSLVNWSTTLFLTPQALPKLDFSSGIPEQWRTLVVVPCMLTGTRSVEDLVEALEIRFLANRDINLHFGLLTDFCDAQQASLPTDTPLLALVRARLDALNAKYRNGKGGAEAEPFFLFHRARQWNPQEQLWMGYERKRGKLAALNSLLRDPSCNAFSVVAGNTSIFSHVKFVITLDTDTQLPLDAARHMIGAMAHPLNRPLYDKAKGRVTEGYGILQPRMASTVPAMNRSRYAHLYGGESGIDPYTRAVSDVYQDVFAEGSFVGKGIYDVDAFEAALKGRFPENRILSHDLLEGCYARSGLLTDVQLYEDYPSSYHVDISRRYRWVRGDWQIAAWLLHTVPRRLTADNTTPKAKALSPLSRWKLLDNLRRSLVATSVTTLLVLGWTILSTAENWTVILLGLMLVPCLCATALELFGKLEEARVRQRITAVARSLSRRLAQFAFEIASLPYEAYVNLDAILRTNWRLHVTHTHLLEWRPAGETERGSTPPGNRSLTASLRAMWFAPLFAIALALYLSLTQSTRLFIASPILLLWFASPAIAWWLSRLLSYRQAELNLDQIHFLRALSRRTWAFFERFVGPEDHWLPPDNYQDYGITAVAHRTSPTNMGLALLANLSAYDFGYITAKRLIERTDNALQTMERLGRYKGHFYNWYDTLTLIPLQPPYISTVDSGNLAGHLLTLRPGLLELCDQAIVLHTMFDGFGDTLRLLVGSATGATKALAAEFRDDLELLHAPHPATLHDVHFYLQRLLNSAERLSADIAKALGNTMHVLPEDETLEWAQALCRQCQDSMDDLVFLAPWLKLGNRPDGLEEFTDFSSIPTLRELAVLNHTLSPRFASHITPETTPAQLDWLNRLQDEVREGCARASQRLATIEALATQAGEMALFEFDFLYDKKRHLLTIGYNVNERRVDSSYYDLLASEARLCNFVAIAQGQLPQESWFALGRTLTSARGKPVLLSWSGSMFEYLMPLLVMPSFDNTLLDETCKAAVARQIEYGDERGVPWGMSESGYNMVDVHLNYQYRAFGVPGLGLKRGLAEDLVIAPYASTLALMVMPEDACLNLQLLAAESFVGKYGFFEAIDYTPSRQRRGQTAAIVHSFMAHHQGMSLLALNYVLLKRPMQRRFESDPQFQAIMMLLHERIPKASALFLRSPQLSDTRPTSEASEALIRKYDTPHSRAPEVQLLSNGRYHIMLTSAGGGYSRHKELAVTRWREDGTRDNWGMFCYIRDVASGNYWSNTYQPTLTEPLSYEAIFSEGRAEYRRRDSLGRDSDEFETHTEVVVSPEDDIELRRIHLTNRSRHRRQFDITSYAEVVIAPHAADATHPAFSNLFVQTEIVPDQRAIICTRRPRALGEPMPWMLHLMAVHGADVSDVSYETDRLRFIGRTQSSNAPAAMGSRTPLSNTDGAVLDPIVAIRQCFDIAPEQTITIDIVTGVANSREAALALVQKYQDRHLADRVFDLGWSYSQVLLRQINATEADSQRYARLANYVVYANAAMRAEGSVLAKNHRGQSGLWGYAISGDLPIVLLKIRNVANLELVRQLVQAHAYWRLKGLVVDLVIWNEDHASYRQRLQDQIMGLIASGTEASIIDRPGGIYVRSSEHISVEDRILLLSVARVIIADDHGTLTEQLDQLPLSELCPPALVPIRDPHIEFVGPITLPRELTYFNGLGGFSADGKEYVIALPPGQVTPAPWVNVLANPQFGTVISESGLAYTWGENAHEFRLTPWNNDIVSDTSGEAFYIRDEESGQFWSPAPLPTRAPTNYVTRHGFGYSVFEARFGDIYTELWVYVAPDAAVKLSVLKVRNESGRTRKLSATGYVEWVLGERSSQSAMHVITEIDPHSGALCARNAYNADFADRVVFFDVDETARSVSGDRAEFLGRNGSPSDPEAMRRVRLSGKVGAALDPCAAIRVGFDLQPGQSREVTFRLGMGRNQEEANALIWRFRGSQATQNTLATVRQQWADTLSTVQVETPDQAINVLVNGWLVYQTLSSRLWARSGAYQSGGAYGFRDQLQDVMALTHTKPGLMREHLLLCASRQFQEGDVQHWWHPPSGRGVRTRCSDDYLWLPLAVCRYVSTTADAGVLDELVPFLEGPAVNADDDSYYDLPGHANDSASLYQHCVQAIQHGLQFGPHGLPLMGSGDWNDGMNRVGIHGKGESVWLAFFLYDILCQFGKLAAVKGDIAFAGICDTEAKRLRQSIEQHSWDGAWYRRAYFDDGTPLGSARNIECQIDSIAQSWSVISAGGDISRARIAMQSLYEHLVHLEGGLIELLAPPFDKSGMDPGYIQGYPPGVRENGGQYTHAAIWAIMALAALGDRERAWELLNIINPVNHAKTAKAVGIYKVEPYVVAADVYACPPHIGRGGWTWYTGSAAWMYRLIVESLLGVTRTGNQLHFAPCLPAHWPSCQMNYRYHSTNYHISLIQHFKSKDIASAVVKITVTLDDMQCESAGIVLVDDHQTHSVKVILDTT